MKDQSSALRLLYPPSNISKKNLNNSIPTRTISSNGFPNITLRAKSRAALRSGNPLFNRKGKVGREKSVWERDEGLQHGAGKT
jgi:hypothetical protein